MQISARNLLPVKVTAIQTGAINAEIALALAGGQEIVAVITNRSVQNLGLAVGSEAFAIVKAPSVIIAKGTPDLKFSARNLLPGTVKKIELGTVNAEVSLELAGGAIISAIITAQSVRSMGLAEGDAACALFKASTVILAVRA
jgi:molybdate transport system regulatory protein